LKVFEFKFYLLIIKYLKNKSSQET